MEEDFSIFPGVNVLPVDTKPIPREDMFDAEGVLMARPSAFWTSKSRAEKMLFGHTHGLYLFPTTELVGEIHQMIGGRTAIEIGAGNGCLSRSLAIPGTDSFQQDDPRFAALYDLAGQPRVKYGAHVEKLCAREALVKYAPKVVVGTWVTHRYIPQRHDLGGNVVGVDEHEVLAMVDDYIFIGNTAIHATKPILRDMEKAILTSHYVSEYFVGSPILQSRASQGLDFLVRITRR